MSVVVNAHLEWMRQRGLSPTTIYSRGRLLARLAAALGKPACEATAADLAGWRAALTVGESATVSYVSHAREFFAWMRDSGLRDDDPAARLPVPRVGRRLPRPIGEDALSMAVDGAPDRVRPWLILAGWAGLRACEIALLRRSAVLDTTAQPFLHVRGDATKGRHERMVPMCGYVLAEVVPVLAPSGWAFRRRDGDSRPNSPARVSHLCNDYLHSAGLPETLHQFRHRFLSQAMAVSHDLRLVQELAGHASPLSTAGYTAVNNADAIAAVQAIPVPRHLRIVLTQTEKEA